MQEFQQVKPMKSAIAREPDPVVAQSAAPKPVQFTPAKPPPSPQPSAPEPARPGPAEAPIVKRKRGSIRFVLLVVVPALALALGVLWWLHGGRYVTTDNSYVGSQKVLITPQVTGPIVAVHVIE